MTSWSLLKIIKKEKYMKITYIGIYCKRKCSLNEYYLQKIIPYENYQHGYIDNMNFGLKSLPNYREDDDTFIISVKNKQNRTDSISDEEIKLLNSLKKNDVIIFDIDDEKISNNISNIRKCKEKDSIDKISLILYEWHYLHLIPL